MMTETILHMLEEAGAVWRYRGTGPHVVYTLGQSHSDFYFHSGVLDGRPQLLDELIDRFLGTSLSPLKERIDFVISYLPFGDGVGRAIGRYLDIPTVFMNSLGTPDLPEVVHRNHRTLVVADDIYTGKSLRILRRVLGERGARIHNEIFVLGNFSGTREFDDSVVVSAFEMQISRWNDQDCPMCAAGSVPLNARDNWDSLKLYSKELPSLLPPRRMRP